ncbi:MAG TPA: histidine phosphatase family protein [Phenylobacterium sp.]|uniref:histidine phosphatase family protein n=1 Tax=Phenylobacterium sp. TaxID=1871053 RepID=UPI002D34BD58|nr:histidine phosphatase family protein [Phenylobacterium sp.]HZZ66958.1 histidine phosphatase family protein [Phenylobacterium sp.]
MTAETSHAPAAQTSSVPPGAITLARHGEPALSRKVRLSSQEYREFWARYEIMGLLPGQTPPAALKDFVAGCDVLIASTRLRAIESAETVGGGRVFDRDAVLVEAPLPPPNWPAWVRLSPRLWGFFARFWWWFFNHHEGGETRRQAEQRADQAAAKLQALALEGRNVVVLAHGFFNLLIGRALRRRGWRMTLREGYKYWSTRRFERR